MPIILIWNTAAAAREKQFKRWLKELTAAAGGLGSWLGKRLKEGSAIEKKTRGFPVFRFYNLALTARVTRAQHGSLLTMPVPGLGTHFQAIGEAWRVDREIADRAREARLIGRLMGALEQMVNGTLDSIQRFASPSPEMFSLEGGLQGGRASDLIGLGALAFRAVGRGRDGILEAGQRVERALRTPPRPKPTEVNPTSEKPGLGTPPPLPLSMRLDEGLRYIAAALLILPAAGVLLIHLGRDALLWLRRFAMDHILAFETMIFDLRQSTLTRIHTGLQQFSFVTTRLFAVVRFHVLAQLRHWTSFTVAYMRGLTQGVSNFVIDFRDFWAGTHHAIQEIFNFTGAIMAIDLTNVIHNVLLTIKEAIEFIAFYYWIIFQPTSYTPPRSPMRVTLGEFALGEGRGSEVRNELGRAMGLLNDAYEGGRGLIMDLDIAVGNWLADTNIEGIVEGTQMLLPRLGVRPSDTPVAQPTLSYSSATEPDLVAQIVTPLREGLSGAIQQGGQTLQQGVETITVGAVTMLDGAADQFGRAALGAVRLGRMGQTRRILGDSAGLVANAFPGIGESQPTGLERLGRVFGLWLRGQFDTLGQITGGFLGFVLDEWRAHLAANADSPVEVTATSPRILLKRAQLGRVHLQTMRITAHADLADDELAQLVAHEFRTAVGQAYVQGQAQFRALPGTE